MKNFEVPQNVQEGNFSFIDVKAAETEAIQIAQSDGLATTNEEFSEDSVLLLLTVSLRPGHAFKHLAREDSHQFGNPFPPLSGPPPPELSQVLNL